MAEGGDLSVEKSVCDLENEITCAICHEHYKDPKVLSCCHYYCKQCIYSLALRTGLDKPFSCPECRKDTTLPQGGVDNLQTAFFINRMKEVHSKLERATGKVEAKCEMCSGAKAEAFCRQCTMFICAECVKQHQRMKVFAGHKTSSLAELKEGGAKEVVTQEPALTMCKLHKEPMKIYCFDCSCLICRDCCMKDHFGHNYEFITVAGPEMKEKLTQHLQPLRGTKMNLSCAVKEVQTNKSDVKVQGHSVTTRIENWFDEIYQIIECRKQELLAEAAKKEACKLERLSSQEKSLSTTCAMVQSVIEYAEQCIEHSADDEIMCMHAELLSRIDRAIEEQQKEGKNLEPVEEADMTVEVSCIEELKQLCQTKAKISQLPIQCTITGKGRENAEVSKMSEVMVKVNLADGRPTKRTHVIKSHLKSLVKGSITKCKVDFIEVGDYRIQYTPTVRGRHELTIAVNGQEVAGSPFPVPVSIHPTKLGKPIRVITNFNRPRVVAASLAGETIVTDEKTISIFDRTGKKLRSCDLSEYDICNPYGLAVDNTDGCVYMTDNGNKKIIKLSPDLKLIREVILEKKSKVRDVTMIGDEVMVCDRDNCILVYTKELKYTREITSHGDGSGHAISRMDASSDEHNNIYITDLDNSLIHVFSNDGAFLRSFGQGGDKMKKLNRPHGVCVAGQYVYVTDYTGHNISVFTTEGEHVTSFGKRGDGKGDFYNPWGVCVDKDGFVYVCDWNNSRVQIF